jgi:hypothetical protein
MSLYSALEDYYSQCLQGRVALLVTACDQYLQKEQKDEHNVQDQVRRQMTGYSHSYKSLTHAVGHDAEQNHKQISTRPVSSDQAGSRRYLREG